MTASDEPIHDLPIPVLLVDDLDEKSAGAEGASPKGGAGVPHRAHRRGRPGAHARP